MSRPAGCFDPVADFDDAELISQVALPREPRHVMSERLPGG
jgi:hypothetical protein